ncbi:MAG TPA: tRNA (adenosine(37)-N6)-threonylcarbamoyltransferase complex dimerization subunit type 1 TsaB [Microlunatus sp.]
MPESAGRTVVLGIDTATVVCVGLAIDGVAVATAQVDDRMAHVEQLTPLVRRVCADAGIGPAELTDVVVGLGPGPYTGLRVGIITARVLADIAGARLRGICSLDVIAAQYAAGRPGGEFVVATDARRKEVYWARYAADGRRLEGPSVNAADEVPRVPTLGPGTVLYPDRLSVVDGPATLDPAILAVVGPRLAEAGVEPLYLRRPDAAEPGRRKSVLVRRGRR